MEISTKNGIVFQQDEGQTILDASINAGFPINHSCRSGRCGFCKVKLITGDTLAYRKEALLAHEKDEKWLLSCCHTAVSDIQIEAGLLEHVSVPKSSSIPCAIDALTFLSPTKLKVSLQLPMIVRFAYLAGQYVNILHVDGVSSGYWLSKAKTVNQKVELHVMANEQDLLNQYWFEQARVGDLLSLEGPLGTFYLRDVANRDVFFLAVKSGVGAIASMLEAHQNLAKDQQAATITVIWQGKGPEDFYLDLKVINNEVRFIQTGKAQELLMNLSPNLSNASVYAIGSSQMIEDAYKFLIQHQLEPGSYFSQASLR